MKYVIAGYGRFGRIALERLKKVFPDREALIIENDREKLSEKLPSGTVAVNMDTVAFLSHTEALEPDDLILPMVPFHLAASYIMKTSQNIHEISLPDEIATKAPNPIRINSSTLLASRADFLCPDDCPEGERCTITGRREEPLYRKLAAITIPGFSVLVQQSYQILPGVGGYPLGDLIKLSGKVAVGRYIVATSCKCHAVLTAIEKN
ncbi:MAG TPA: hypothetical protein VMC85_16650 [Desulfomonilaceae bacterium]|nr:hypothetical protein [Desulfomonilaceae bacterium]